MLVAPVARPVVVAPLGARTGREERRRSLMKATAAVVCGTSVDRRPSSMSRWVVA
jgi:hypothetical protein